MQRQGNTLGLEPFAEEQHEISKQISAVEKTQGEGCSNVFFWAFLIIGIFFCGIGFLSRTFFQNNNIPLVVGWAISLLSLTIASGVLLRFLNTQRAERLKLEAKQARLHAEDSEES